MSTCNCTDDHCATTDRPVGNLCGAPATHVIYWGDGSKRFSLACAKHLQIDDSASVKPGAIIEIGDRRWWDVEFGIRYTICARDEKHALEVLQKADYDYADTLKETGGGSIVEIPLDEAAKRVFWDEPPGEGSMRQVPITTMQLGDWASSEY